MNIITLRRSRLFRVVVVVLLITALLFIATRSTTPGLDQTFRQSAIVEVKFEIQTVINFTLIQLIYVCRMVRKVVRKEINYLHSHRTSLAILSRCLKNLAVGPEKAEKVTYYDQIKEMKLLNQFLNLELIWLPQRK